MTLHCTAVSLDVQGDSAKALVSTVASIAEWEARIRRYAGAFSQECNVLAKNTGVQLRVREREPHGRATDDTSGAPPPNPDRAIDFL